MRMTGVRDFRAHLTRYVSGEEPVLLTRHGKVSGLYLPLEDASRVPDDLPAFCSQIVHQLRQGILRPQTAAPPK